jgi:type IV pilus assembly protein PilP
MVGTLEQIGATWGLVKTKEGTVHKVKRGNYMGQNHGRIMLISEDRIELTEIVQDGSGGYIERQASLALAE